MNLKYISATEEDIHAIFAQQKALVDQYEDRTLIPYEKVLAWMRKKLAEKIGQYTCVTLNGEKVAFFRLDTDGDMVELDDLYVLPPFRGQGIGTQILCACIQKTKKPIFLCVFKGNTGACRLYQRMGFSVLEDVSPTRCRMIRKG